MVFTPFGSTTPSALRGSGTAPLVGAGTTGDTNNRVELDADGGIRWGSGSAAVDTALTRNGVANLQVTNTLQASGFTATATGFQANGGNVDIATAGKGLFVAEGANAKQGTAVLVAGTVTVANTSVTANSRIFLTSQADGGTPGFLRVTARVAGTSFTITSSNAADTSTVAYEIFEPG
jgi:hypothetical protein